MTTPRATEYLASLKRLTPVPTSAVEQSLSSQGAPCFDVWVSMHEKYAGYIEQLGSGDYAVWGIVHHKPNWLSPLVAQIDREVKEPIWYVTCADVHPSYVYNLDQDGRFFVPPTANFDVYVERNALVWEFFQRGQARRAEREELRNEAVLHSIQREIESGALTLVQEASDDSAQYFSGSTLLIKKDVESTAIKQIWRRI